MSGSNPKVALKVCANPGKLTLARIALLESTGNPILDFNVDSLRKNAEAIYIYTAPLEELTDDESKLSAKALAYIDGLSVEEFREELKALVDELETFYLALPRPDEAAKKKIDTATDG